MHYWLAEPEFLGDASLPPFPNESHWNKKSHANTLVNDHRVYLMQIWICFCLMMFGVV